MNQYRELLQKHQQEVNVLPIRYADLGEQAISGDDECLGPDPRKTSTKFTGLEIQAVSI